MARRTGTPFPRLRTFRPWPSPIGPSPWTRLHSTPASGHRSFRGLRRRAFSARNRLYTKPSSASSANCLPAPSPAASRFLGRLISERVASAGGPPNVPTVSFAVANGTIGTRALPTWWTNGSFWASSCLLRPAQPSPTSRTSVTLHDSPKWDAIVFGGGPAGLAAAIPLGRPHFRVLGMERSNYDRVRLGEALSPAAQTLLRALGVWSQFLRDGHLPSPGRVWVWGRPEPYDSDF